MTTSPRRVSKAATPGAEETETDLVTEISVLLFSEAEKVHSWRFKEQVGPGGQAVLGTIYIPKSTLEAIGNPKCIEFVLRPYQQ